MNDRHLYAALACLAALSAPGCSSGGGSQPLTGTTSFQISGISVSDGAVWQINREIVLTFTEPIDFSTVSANTINIRSSSNVPATGVFHLRDPQTVVFQPTCPTRDDYADAGLLPGGLTYVLRIPGVNTSSNTLRSVTGVPLGLQQTRTFSTPASTQPAIIFQDSRQGPPAPLVRGAGSTATDSTYLEVGGNPNERVYFLVDDAVPAVPGADQDGDGQVDDADGDGRDDDDAPELSEQAFRVPLNLYSEQATRVALLIAFDQPVNPSSTNISESRLRLEFSDAPGSWRAIDTRVTLVANCTATGASVRLEPVGVLPPGSALRAVVLAGFQDIVGEANLVSLRNFAVAPTRLVDFPSLVPRDLLSDEFFEPYDFGGSSPFSFEDTTALFDTPVAEWGEGRLSAAFSFEGTGGPNGDFDWVVRPGEIFFFDTTNTPIVGGPNGVPTTTLNAVNGVVDVRNLIIEEGGEVRVQGPNPMFINATGEVRIRGRLDLSGFSAKDVATLNTGNQVEIGGAGTAGGGKGGNANDNIGGPTPRGGTGQGPFRQGPLGGQGGEMGFSPGGSKDARRPGGGGGGRFAKDWISVMTFSDLSTVAGPGNNGNRDSIGSESQTRPARGGSPGAGPFLDSSDANDYFGVRPLVSSGQLTGLVRGELPRLWAGYGGGGGGNAGRSFPNPSWNFNSDEKGGGGGGGAGGLHIKALGRIVFGPQGQILANGARGGTGENTNFLDHIGGTGGGGSGGHVILESAALVDFTDGGAQVSAALRDIVVACGPKLKTGPLGDVNGCCRADSNGGPGGAGVIQLHVPNPLHPPGPEFTPANDIVVPTAALTLPLVLDGVTSPPAFVMIPTFGKQSKARSKWISIGGADQKPGGSEGLVRFLFDGIRLPQFPGDPSPDVGRILTNGSTVADLAPLVTEDNLDGSTSARILPDGFTLELTGAKLEAIRAGMNSSGISNDLYLRTPALLKGCAVRMRVVQTPANFEDFTIASAIYDEGGPSSGDEALRITVTTERGRLDAFNPNPGPSMTTGFHIVPRFFQVVTNGLPNSLPTTAFVKLRFQAAAANVVGEPDEANLLTGWTSDIREFNALDPGRLQFFRYEVEFDLDVQNLGVTADTEPVTIDFLKIPFVF